MAGPILTALQNWRDRRAAGERPLLDAIRAAFQGPPQPQRPAPAVQQRPATQPAPTPPQASAMAPSVPMQRPGGPSPPMAPMVPMQRPTASATPMVPMQRPGPPLPRPNPERMAPMGAPGPSQPMRMNWGIDVPQMGMPQAPGMMQFNEGMMMADQGNFMPEQAGNAPVEPVDRTGLGWRAAGGTPDIYGPGRAVPRGTSTSISDTPVQPPGFDALLDQFPGVQGGGMAGAVDHYNSLPTPQRRNIEVMNMQQLQDFIRSGDPSGPELERANRRLEQLRVAAMMMGQGVAPGGVPAGPGV